MSEISQTVTLYLVFLWFALNGWWWSISIGTCGITKKLQTVLLDAAVCICTTCWTYHYNVTIQNYFREISRDTNLHYATFLYRNSSSSEKEVRYVLKLYLQSDSNTILTKQHVSLTFNKYHAIKTSKSVDLRIRWRSVSTSQPAPLLLRESQHNTSYHDSGWMVWGSNAGRESSISVPVQSPE
jgi:hypothetical protein